MLLMSLPLRNWTQSAGEEVANGINHGIGLAGAIIGTPILLVAAFHHRDLPFLIGTITFSTTMLLVYLRYRRLAMTLYLGTGWLGLMLIRQLALTIPLSSVLINCRRQRLYGRHFILCERAPALWPFHLASVRACR
jgi:predicted membrane channel-forming protein YqfA (hemolysin III family)